MESEIRIFDCPDGQIQRVHVARFDSWSELTFLRPEPSEEALSSFERIYRQFLVPAAPWVFGNLVMFRLPEGQKIPESLLRRYEGRVSDPLTVAALSFHRYLTVIGKKAVFRDEEAAKLWRELKAQNCIRIVRGKLPITTVIPVSNNAGYMTGCEKAARMKVNASFFIMDPFDCATVYDHVGVPFGLLVKDGVVENPPLYAREALLVKKDGSVQVKPVELSELRIRINGRVFTPGENAALYTRPKWALTPPGGKCLAIVGRRVAAVGSGVMPVPASGFVLRPGEDFPVMPGDEVTYEGMEDICFGIQVGNSILRDGVKTEKFISKFYNVRGIQRIAYPPSLYPLDFENARAARIALGADAEGKPMILWAEGAAKIGHVPGRDSRGASLSDMSRLCAQVGMVNAVNLDGGGSAQLLTDNKRSLRISDRKEDGSESERPVPLGLIVR